MANFRMASKMATKMGNPATESETLTRLLSDVQNVLNLKPKMHPQPFPCIMVLSRFSIGYI